MGSVLDYVMANGRLLLVNVVFQFNLTTLQLSLLGIVLLGVRRKTKNERRYEVFDLCIEHKSTPP